MSFFHQDFVVDAIASVAPSGWVYYLAGGVVTATTFALLSHNLLASPTHKNGIPLPPGPPAKWFWENPMPKQNIALGLASWVEQYGPVYSLRRGRKVTIVIGSMDAATEIMEKEGGSLVDRPRMIAVGEILSKGMRLISESAGDRFRRLRRAAHTHLQPKAVATYEETHVDAAKQVVSDILDDPKHHVQHAKRFGVSIILRIVYGKTSPTTNNDPEVVRVHKVAANFQAAIRPGAYLVDFIPWLKYVPGYASQLKEHGRYELELFRDQFNRVKTDIAAGRTDPSFVRTLLAHMDDHRLSNDEMAYLAGSLFGAGSGTTSSAISVMIMAAACHPGAQARVQEELDEVVGRDKVPTFADRDMLPQLEAFLLEAMRWRPVSPLGIPHRASKDIFWRGQCIPAGATVMGSIWALTRDPQAFPDPETFNPGRWLTEDGRMKKDMHFYMYGFGRRTCPGQHLANRSLFISLALLLWAFRIERRPDVPIDMHATMVRDVIVFQPKPFDVEFVPRMEERRLRELLA